jgi:hypothetical protein
LSISEFHSFDIKRLSPLQGFRLAGLPQLQEFLGLFLQLDQRRAGRQDPARIGHGDLLSVGPRPHDGLKEDRMMKQRSTVGSALSCGQEAPETLLRTI